MVFKKNQGIGSILESSNKSSSSLRRTLSADMSSTKWLTQHGFCPMKKIASSEEFSICSITDSSSSEDEDVETEPRSQFDIWSSIIQQKSQEITDNKSLPPPPPPYIHPLVKRSASSLNQKSLQICTESLGSETGSDGLFSSYPSSVSGDVTDDDDDKETEQDRALEQSFEEGFVPRYNYVAKKSPQRQRSFPPPMPSRRMQWRRDNGRLVLEAVSVPCTNNFLAQRRDGRLVLTFANGIEQEEEEEEKKEIEKLELEEVFENFNDEDKESDEEEVEAAFVMELEAPRVSSTSRVINVHRLTPMGLANRDPITTWPNKFNEVVKFDEDEEDIKPAIVAKSLPPMALLIPKPPVGMGTAAAAGGGGGGGGGRASFNAYEYYWRPNPMTVTQSKNNKKNTQEEKQQLLLLRGNKGENLVPLVKSCKEPRRSLLFWEPYCIATS